MAALYLAPGRLNAQGLSILSRRELFYAYLEDSITGVLKSRSEVISSNRTKRIGVYGIIIVAKELKEERFDADND